MPPSRDQLIQNIQAMEAQGAPQGDIQAYLDQFKGQAPVAPDPGVLSKIGTFASDLFKNIAAPIVETGVRAGQVAGYGTSRLLGASPEQAYKGAFETPIKPVPIIGQEMRPAAEETLAQTLGRGIQTVGLGFNPLTYAGGAKLGGSLGFGEALAEGKSLEETALQTAGGALAAPLTLAGVRGTGKVLGPVANFLGSTRGKTAGEIGSEIASEGKRIATKAADIITPVEKGVQTVLENPKVAPAKMASKLSRYKAQAEKAVADYSEKTPLEMAGEEGQKALTKIQSKLNTIGQKKKDITRAIGDKKVGSIVSDARTTMRELLEDRAGVKLSEKGRIGSAKGRASTLSDPSDLRLIRNIDSRLRKISKKPTFQKVDDTIDYIQDELFKRSANTAIPVNSNVESILKNITSNLNKNLKTIGGKQYMAANDSYSKIVKVRDLLNKGLGKDANKGAALMKQLFSPSGTLPRKLFSQVKSITGVDLVEEATLAKFVMENIGDVRQASLLEQVLKGGSPSKSGLIQIAAEKTLGRLQSPIGKAERLIQKRSK